jgi:hypothetical protein
MHLALDRFDALLPKDLWARWMQCCRPRALGATEVTWDQMVTWLIVPGVVAGVGGVWLSRYIPFPCYLASPGPASDAWAYPSGTYAWAGRGTPLPRTATKAASIVKVSNLLRSIDISFFWCQWMLGNGQSPGGRPIYLPDECAEQI